MITINLLRRGRPTEASRVEAPSSAVPAACGLILLMTTAGVGWWHWSLTRQALRMDANLAAARQEAGALKGVAAAVEQFDRRRAQLRRRLDVIDQLRSNQSAPMQLVEDLSRSLPDMLWLTHLKQTGTEVVIEGRSTTLLALSDLIANLAGGQVFERPVEMVDSQVESAGPMAAQAGIIRFTVKARVAGAPGVPQRGAEKGPGR